MKAAAVGNKVREKRQHPICFDLFLSDCNFVINARKGCWNAVSIPISYQVSMLLRMMWHQLNQQQVMMVLKHSKEKPLAVLEIEHFLNEQSNDGITKALYKCFSCEGYDQFIE